MARPLLWAPPSAAARVHHPEVAVKPKLRPIFVLSPEPEARRELDAALDTLADAIADQILSRARAEVCGDAATPAAVPGAHSRPADLLDAALDGVGR